MRSDGCRLLCSLPQCPVFVFGLQDVRCATWHLSEQSDSFRTRTQRVKLCLVSLRHVGMQGDEDWLAYTGLHGPLQHLLSEQSGVLVGPRPEKPAPVSQASGKSEGVFGGGNMFSTEQLVRFLQSIGKGGGPGFT